MEASKLIIDKPFALESGSVLPRLEIAYHTYGSLNSEKDNVIWICHALTANSNVADWWHGLFGEGKLFDPKKYFIVCANILGSCYGTTGPLSIHPQTGEPYYNTFPLITVRDMVKAHIILRKHLGIKKVLFAIGGSLGGQQVLEWAITEPGVIEKIAPIATNARHSPWGIAFNASQRMAIETDPDWGKPIPNAGSKGLKVARSIAMLSYRHYTTYQKTQSDKDNKVDNFRASTYQDYQGVKLVRRFNAYSYWHLSKAMDSHDVSRGRGDIKSALATIQSEAIAIGIKTDVLFPVKEQKLLADNIPGARYEEIHSDYGHDGFLIENEQLTEILTPFLKSPTSNSKSPIISDVKIFNNTID